MKAPLLLISLCFWTLFTYSNCQLPIPSKYPGHARGSPNGPILLEAYYDHLCPDSKESWPSMKQVIQHYGPTLNFYCHAFPLPYHRNAFLVAQAGLIVEKEKDEDAWFEWLELMFANQNQFGTMETNNVTGDDVVQQLAKYASSFGIDTTFFMNGMKYGSEFDSDARIEWKYATTRGVYGTPIYFVNGVFLPDASSWSFARWKKLIDSLLETKLH